MYLMYATPPNKLMSGTLQFGKEGLRLAPPPRHLQHAQWIFNDQTNFIQIRLELSGPGSRLTNT